MRDHMLYCDNQGRAVVWSCKATLSESADVEAYNFSHDRPSVPR